MTTLQTDQSLDRASVRSRSLADRWRRFARPPRLMGVDVARGLAVFGMIGVHAGIAMSAESGSGLSPAALVEGRSSILFAVVAGISIALATGVTARPTGEELRSARLRMAGRALAVLAIGLILELLGSDIAVILPIYGVLFLIVIPFIGLRRRTLVAIAASLALAGPTLFALVRVLALGTSGSGVEFLLNGSYPLTVWLPLILGGLAVGRSALGATKTAATVLGIGLLLAVGGYAAGSAVAGSPSAWLVQDFSGFSAEVTSSGSGDGSSAVVPSSSVSGSDLSSGTGPVFGSDGGDGSSGNYLDRLGSSDVGSAIASAWGVSPHSGGTFEILGSGGFALVVIGACLLLARPLRWLLLPVAAVGSMPLTAYAAHVVSFAVLIAPVALAPGLVPFGTGNGTGFWLGSVGVLLVGCTLWALIRGRGPLERVTAWAARSVNGASPVATAPVGAMSADSVQGRGDGEGQPRPAER